MRGQSKAWNDRSILIIFYKIFLTRLRAMLLDVKVTLTWSKPKKHRPVVEIEQNKKVLLRERKRHTARRVVSTPSVVLPGYPPQQGTPPILTWPGGYLTRVPPRPGYPPGGVPDQGTPLARIPPPSWPGRGGTWPGYPPARVPPWGGTWPGYPPGQGTPPARVPPGGVPDQGTPPARVPPQPGYPPWPGYPRGVPDQVTPPGQGTPQPGYPPGGYLTRVPPSQGTPQGGYLTRVPPRPGYPPILTWLGGYLTG